MSKKYSLDVCLEYLSWRKVTFCKAGGVSEGLHTEKAQRLRAEAPAVLASEGPGAMHEHHTLSGAALQL